MKRVALAVIGTDVLPGLDPAEKGPMLARQLTLKGWSVETLQLIPETGSDLSCFLKNWAGRVACLLLYSGLPIQGSKSLLTAVADLLEVPFPPGGDLTDLLGAEVLSVPDSGVAGLRFFARGSRILVLSGEPRVLSSFVRSEFEGEAPPCEPGSVRVIGLSPGQVRERLRQVSSGDKEFPLSVSCAPNVVTLSPLTPEWESPKLPASLCDLFAGDCLPPDVDSLAQVVLQESRRTGASLAAAESCTGGLIGAELTGPAGASVSFLGSAVCYSNEAKMDILHVPRSVLDTRGAVSEECAFAMARGARQLYRSSLAVSVTGIAGPDGGSRDKPVGTVWFGLSSKKGDRAFMRCFRDMDRREVRLWTVAVALEALWRCLKGEMTH